MAKRPPEDPDHASERPTMDLTHEEPCEPFRGVLLRIDPERPTRWVVAELVYCVGRDLCRGFRRRPRTTTVMMVMAGLAATQTWWHPVAGFLRHVGARVLAP